MARSRAGRPPGDASSAERFLPRERSLRALRAAAESCRGCHLWERATQTVFGDGDGRGKAMLVGEQPGNDEDLQGRPFVGPAGALLDRALAEAGIARDRVYVTNVVKHFKWEGRGPRRIHAKPNAREIAACLPWLQAELDVIKPRALVCLGATAAQALLGKSFRVTRQRGQPVASTLAPFVMATVHPSSILRAPDDDARREQYEAFVEDLKTLAQPLR
jgi:DNA polymerase